LLSQVDDAAQFVLAGDLSRFRGQGLHGVEREAIPVENDLFGDSHGRLHIPLSGENKLQLKKETLSMVGIRTHIRDVELVRYGRLLFQAHNFFGDDVLFSGYFQEAFLVDLETHGLIEIIHAWPQAHITFGGSRQQTRYNLDHPHAGGFGNRT
jgi:hypothetical protein